MTAQLTAQLTPGRHLYSDTSASALAMGITHLPFSTDKHPPRIWTYSVHLLEDLAHTLPAHPIDGAVITHYLLSRTYDGIRIEKATDQLIYPELIELLGLDASKPIRERAARRYIDEWIRKIALIKLQGHGTQDSITEHTKYVSVHPATGTIYRVWPGKDTNTYLEDTLGLIGCLPSAAHTTGAWARAIGMNLLHHWRYQWGKEQIEDGRMTKPISRKALLLDGYRAAGFTAKGAWGGKNPERVLHYWKQATAVLCDAWGLPADAFAPERLMPREGWLREWLAISETPTIPQLVIKQIDRLRLARRRCRAASGKKAAAKRAATAVATTPVFAYA